MAGTSLENGDASIPCASNGDRETSPHALKHKNGIRIGFLNGQKPVVHDNEEPDKGPEESYPEYVPTFSQATPPSMVTVDTTSITLQWSAITQTGLSAAPPEGTDFPPCSIAYSLQMQQVCTEGFLQLLYLLALHTRHIKVIVGRDQVNSNW